MGAEKKLLKCVQTWNQQAHSRLVHKGVKRKYNPPSASHHGGLWKGLVRSWKGAFYSILGTRKLAPEVLDTTFCSFEQYLNERPLTPVNSDSDNLAAITLYHFLLSQASAKFPSLRFGEEFIVRAQAYSIAIWSRWLREYVPGLNEGAKRHSS